MEALRILAKQTDGGLRTQNRCSKYRITLEQNAGSIYKELPDEITGRPEKSSHDVTTYTTKQQAVKETEKNRMTLSRWAKEAAKSEIYWGEIFSYWKIAELLPESPLKGRPEKVSGIPTLSELGLKRDNLHLWRRLRNGFTWQELEELKKEIRLPGLNTILRDLKKQEKLRMRHIRMLKY